MTDEYAVVVHVQRKLPRSEVAADRLVPSELRAVTQNGEEVIVRTDVQERAAADSGVRQHRFRDQSRK